MRSSLAVTSCAVPKVAITVKSEIRAFGWSDGPKTALEASRHLLRPFANLGADRLLRDHACVHLLKPGGKESQVWRATK